MAARKRRLALSESWKDNIRAGVLAQRLYAHANGEIELSNTQIKAADILLKKLIPDLGRTEISADPNNPPNLGLTVTFVAANAAASAVGQ